RARHSFPTRRSSDLTVGRLHTFRSFLVLVIELKYTGAAEQNLAVVSDLDLDFRRWRPDGIGVDFPIGLHGDVDGGFRLPVELFRSEEHTSELQSREN